MIGFSLIEMLVVLVILALTTSLMTQGLSTTWNNFARLGARDLLNSSAQLPLSWFSQSLAGAVLYHPDTVSASGDDRRFEFITFMAPDDQQHIPQKIIWELLPVQNGWQLAFSSETHPDRSYIKSFSTLPVFEYRVDQQWQKEFKPDSGRLPEAVRLIEQDYIWAVAKTGRPENADIPAELPIFGKYEF
ncbi:PulJ/GspJ family protein [Neptunicella sp. SCSIO 80796]|uniref:PulJ/GspJ family protein n=1 Tax=Neptunicella plasticusilytica TaxID=3117012 RepID=UPI003A4D9C2E